MALRIITDAFRRFIICVFCMGGILSLVRLSIFWLLLYGTWYGWQSLLLVTLLALFEKLLYPEVLVLIAARNEMEHKACSRFQCSFDHWKSYNSSYSNWYIRSYTS